jgi:spermidine synthase
MAHAFLGSALLKMGQRNVALAHLQRSLEIQPNQSSVHSSLGVVLMELGRLEESLSHLQSAVKLDPESGEAHYNLGNALLQMQQANEAIAEYNEALRLNHDDAEALNNLAWILATSPDALTRDATKAVEFAERADALTHRQNPVIGATLAAAYAEAGRFGEALKSAQRALQLANNEGNAAQADSIRAQIEVYQSGAAFRDRRRASTSR